MEYCIRITTLGVEPIIKSYYNPYHTAKAEDRRTDHEATNTAKTYSLIYGNVYYVDDNCEKCTMKYIYYDKRTNSLRYTFKYNMHGNEVFRIKRKESIHILPKISRTSKKYNRIYKKGQQ